jgi:hypothetical protein
MFSVVRPSFYARENDGSATKRESAAALCPVAGIYRARSPTWKADPVRRSRASVRRGRPDIYIRSCAVALTARAMMARESYIGLKLSDRRQHRRFAKPVRPAIRTFLCCKNQKPVAIMREELSKVDRLSRTESSGEQMAPTSKCTGCNRDRELFAVERLATRAYVLHTFCCPACASYSAWSCPQASNRTALTGVLKRIEAVAAR